MFVWLKVTLFGLVVRLLAINKVVRELLELDFVEADLDQRYFLRSIKRKSSMKVKISLAYAFTSRCF